jgi:hypothetical protein
MSCLNGFLLYLAGDLGDLRFPRSRQYPHAPVVVIGRCWPLLSDLGRPRDGPDRGPRSARQRVSLCFVCLDDRASEGAAGGVGELVTNRLKPL